jgi:hypothetical protein
MHRRRHASSLIRSDRMCHALPPWILSVVIFSACGSTQELDGDAGDGGADGGPGSDWYSSEPPLGEAGCPAPAQMGELGDCLQTSDCGCHLMDCVFDVQLGKDVCEYTCRDDADCLSWDTRCENGACTPIFCGYETGNGSLDGLCSAFGTDDGTCVPWGDRGVCVQGGTSTTRCHSPLDCFQEEEGGLNCTALALDRLNVPPEERCAAGLLCIATFSDGVNWAHCYEPCDPLAETDTCPAGQRCYPLPINLHAGGCCPEAGCPQP